MWILYVPYYILNFYYDEFNVLIFQERRISILSIYGQNIILYHIFLSFFYHILQYSRHVLILVGSHWPDASTCITFFVRVGKG